MVALAVVVYSAHRLGLHPGPGDIALYGLLVFWRAGRPLQPACVDKLLHLLDEVSAQGLEASYFTLAEFGRLPREAFKGMGSLFLVWLLPVGS